MTDGSRIPAFVNRGSGNYEKAREALASSGRFDVREVDPAKLEREIRDAVAKGATRILVAGGDGSICAGAAAVSGTSAELAVLPAGTLNHFAIDNGIPLDLAEAAKVAIGTSTTRVDVGFAGERLFLNTSSIGAYVTFVRLRDRLEKRFGYRLASLFAMVRVFALLRTVRLEIEVNGRLQYYRTPLVFVGLGEREFQVPSLGKRVKGGERALHVFVVRGRERARLFGVAVAAVVRGVDTVARMPDVDAFLVERSRIDMRGRRAVVAFDGETEVMKLPLDYHIERDALTIVVPEAVGEASDEPPARKAVAV